jgi:hypothetical protein
MNNAFSVFLTHDEKGGTSFCIYHFGDIADDKNGAIDGRAQHAVSSNGAFGSKEEAIDFSAKLVKKFVNGMDF